MDENASLVLDAVTAGYGDTVVIEDLSIAVPAKGTLAVLGRNGVGKTTLLATIMGATTIHSGTITYGGHGLNDMPVFRRTKLGIAWVPQEREIFRSLSVEENLAVAERPGRWTRERVLDFFPSLAARRSNHGDELSGGEQQMLSIGRALISNPDIILMDEPMEGLSPIIIDRILRDLNRIRSEDHVSIILVEQHARIALEFCDQALVLDRGKSVYSGDSASLRASTEDLTNFLNF